MARLRPARAPATADPVLLRWLLTAVAVAAVAGFVLLPVGAVFAQALERGLGAYGKAIAQPETRAAIRLTLLAAGIAVVLNLVFGVAAAWLLARFRFRGKSLLITIIDVPFSVSPVVSGLMFVLLCGSQGIFGAWLDAHDVKIIFAVPGIVLATTFVTLPFVARELAAHMQSLGGTEEEAALTLGAGGWRILLRVALPKAKWGLVYGVILCAARAMGEFGAVSVVSGHVRGVTNTIPLEVEILYNEYDFVGAFAVASLPTLVAVAALGFKQAVEDRRRATPWT